MRDETLVGVEDFPGRKVTSVGLKVLGNYVGKREYRITEGARALAAMIPNQQAMRKLPPRVQFHLLHYCVNNRPTFLMRAMGPAILGGGLETFDQSVDECLRNLLSLPMGDALFRTLNRGIGPNEAGALPVVLLEEAAAIHATNGTEDMVKVDISVATGGSIKYIDIAVVDPGCPTYVACGSNHTELMAAKVREDQKIADFARRMPGVDVENCFVPFVVETCGRLGARAEKYLADCGLSEAAARRFLRTIPMLLARRGGRSLRAVRDGTVRRRRAGVPARPQ